MKFDNCSSDDLYVLAEKIKRETFELDNFNINPYSFVSPSAYDTAWLARIEDLNDVGTQKPMFQGCLDWILSNQNVEEGLWGRHGDESGDETLTSTLACVLALRKWNIGCLHVHKEKLMDGRCNRQPLLAYLEVLPSISYSENQEDIFEKLNDVDGSLFQSPSATAATFMLTRNTNCLAYLQSLVQRCPHGVPQVYPLSEELIKLSMVNIMDNFGLGEYFGKEIDHFLLQTYKNYKNEAVERTSICSKVDQLHKDSLEFRMLRMKGFDVLPRSFCWFLNDEEILDHLKKNIDILFLVMLSVYRATDLMFPGEFELDEAREFSRKLLEKGEFIDDKLEPSFHIKHEMSTPWMARLQHLDHRMWIEDKDSNAFSIGKASLIRIYSDKLTYLASRNFELRQAVYRREMEDLVKWVKNWGLSDIGFGREKTTYCYFAASSSTSLPFESATNVRKLMAKSGILITVADDFFDEEGSVDELEALTKAVLRWEGEELKGYGKIIFKALDSLLKETAETCRKQHGTDITNHLRNIWSVTLESWQREAEWSKKGHIPSMEEYLRNAIISTAAHTIVLPISCLMES